MPIYEYRCEDCGEVNEHLVLNRNAPPPKACKSCGGGPLERLISRSAFHLKGEGWYVTDYKSSGPPSSKSPAGSESTAGTSSSDPGAAAASDSSASSSSSSPTSSSSGGSGDGASSPA